MDRSEIDRQLTRIEKLKPGRPALKREQAIEVLTQLAHLLEMSPSVSTVDRVAEAKARAVQHMTWQNRH